MHLIRKSLSESHHAIIIWVPGRSCTLSCSWQSLEWRKAQGKSNICLPSSSGHQNLRACSQPCSVHNSSSLPSHLKQHPNCSGIWKRDTKQRTALRFDTTEYPGGSSEHSRITAVSVPEDHSLLLPRADLPILTRSIAHLKQYLPQTIQPGKTLFY